MRPVFSAVLPLAFAASLLYPSAAAANNNVENFSRLPAYEAARQDSFYRARPVGYATQPQAQYAYQAQPQPVSSYQSPAIPGYLPQARAQAYGAQTQQAAQQPSQQQQQPYAAAQEPGQQSGQQVAQPYYGAAASSAPASYGYYAQAQQQAAGTASVQQQPLYAAVPPAPVPSSFYGAPSHGAPSSSYGSYGSAPSYGQQAQPETASPSYASTESASPYSSPYQAAYPSGSYQTASMGYGQQARPYAPAPSYGSSSYYSGSSYAPQQASYGQPQSHASASAHPSYAQQAYPADPWQAPPAPQPYQQQSYVQQPYASVPQGQESYYSSTQKAVARSSQKTARKSAEPAPEAEDAEDEASFAAEPRKGGRNRGYYFALRSGITVPSEIDYSGGGGITKSEYNIGWQLSSAFGYAFRPWAAWVAPRAEAELGYFSNSITSHSFGATTFTDPAAFGTLTSLNFMANGYTDFYVSRWFQPYLMAGLGGGYIDFDRQGVNATGVQIDDTTFGFAWQAGTGFNIPLGGGTMMDVGYRYLQTMGLEVRSGAGTRTDIDVGNHIIQIGVRTPIRF